MSDRSVMSACFVYSSTLVVSYLVSSYYIAKTFIKMYEQLQLYFNMIQYEVGSNKSLRLFSGHYTWDGLYIDTLFVLFYLGHNI